jgi:Flp pilus assembly protein TadG
MLLEVEKIISGLWRCQLVKIRVTMSSGRSNREKGSILVWMSLMSVLVLAFLAFAFDGGYFYQQKRRMQTAADGAALAGALEKKRNPDATPTEVEDTGRQDSAKNGFTHGSSNITVTINQPPTTGAYAGNNGYVEALITQQHQTFFASLFNLLTPAASGNFNQTNIRARAVAGPGSSNCIYVLHPSAPAAFEISSGSVLNAGCGVQVNSTSSTALSITSASHLNSTDINITGNYQATSGSTASPTPDTGEPAVPDPLAWLQPPTYSGCNYTNVTVDLPPGHQYPDA